MGRRVPLVRDGAGGLLVGPVSPALVDGVAWFPAVFTVSRTAAELDAEELCLIGDTLAGLGDCEGAEETWSASRAHVRGDSELLERHEPVMHEALARCWFDRAGPTQQGKDAKELARHRVPRERIEAMLLARKYAPEDPEILAAALALALERNASGVHARSRGAWGISYTAFRDAVRLDPSRSWARKGAEQVRMRRFTDKKKH